MSSTLAPRTLRRLAGYGLTAGTAAIVNLGGFAALDRAGVAVPLASAVAFGVSALVNYALTSLFVFRQPLGLGRLGSFLVFASLGFCMNVGVTSALALGLRLPHVAAQVAGIGTAFLFNFWLNTAVVFAAPKAPGR